MTLLSDKIAGAGCGNGDRGMPNWQLSSSRFIRVDPVRFSRRPVVFPTRPAANRQDYRKPLCATTRMAAIRCHLGVRNSLRGLSTTVE